MKLVVTLCLIGLAGCAPHRERVDVVKGSPGAPGKDAVSCVVKAVEGGVSLTCADGTVFVANGLPGDDGAAGPAGPSLGQMSAVVISGCTLIETGLYGKLVGAGSLKLYSTAACSGSAVASLSSTDELYILVGGNMLIFQSGSSTLYKLTFN